MAPTASREGVREQTYASPLQRPLASYYLVVGATAMLLLVGLVMVLSASNVKAYQQSGSSYSIFTQQAMWTAIGVPAFLVAARLPVRFYRVVGYPMLLVSIGLLVVVPFIGRGAYGATRWINVGPIHVQPSEVTKLALVLWGSDLLVRKAKLLADWRHLLVPLVPTVALIAVLVMVERDMGTTLVTVMIMFGLLFVVGAPGRVLSGLGGAALAGAVLLAVVEPYRLARVTAFLHPSADPLSTGYQGHQGLITIASGRIFGVGLGASRQSWGYLPNQYTDYIFAVTGEQLGLVGTLGLLTLIWILAYAGIRIARRTTDPFARLAAAGVTVWLMAQAIINMGAVVGLLPITGIPLPLISFGGSALVPTLVGLGMLASFARREPGVAEVLAARQPLHRRLFRRAAERAGTTTYSTL